MPSVRVATSRALLVGILAAVATLMPRPAAAVTVDEIVALSKAGVSEAVILALLDRDGTVLTIAPAQIVSLKREGLSDTLILAMLKNGRAEAEDAARADAALNAANILSGIALSTTPTPNVVVVGHGPELPNTVYSTEGPIYSSRRGFIPPYVPYAPWSVPSRKSARLAQNRGVNGFGNRIMCVAQVNTPLGPGMSYVTECPAVMQPKKLY
jgi:hypothetical protein